ncbi:MAG: hypothetical protein QXH48_06170 [Candidatus Bathyarchaeia archaeon]
MSLAEGMVEGFKVVFASFDDIILGIAIEIGPRILYLGLRGKPGFNLFGVLPGIGRETPEGFWKIYGGHRLWVSPEALPRSYSLDDKPVKVESTDGEIGIYGNPEPENSVRKSIRLKKANGKVEVTHIIENIGRWPIKLSCWALSVMRKGGFAILPIEPCRVDKEGLLPDRRITLWPYTHLTDSRLILSDRYVFVKQDPTIKKPFKIGVKANPTWIAYWVEGYVFVKSFKYEEGEYPDYGCNAEVYTNADMLELETLSPLRYIDPSGVAEHKEVWHIFEVGYVKPEAEDVDRKIARILSI